MATKHHVYSTLSNSQHYTNFVKGGGDMPIDLPPVLIKGGSGVAGEHFVTPQGVVTEVTDEQLEYLRQNPSFLHHEKHGFVSVSKSKTDPEKVAADMTRRDQSAPIVPPDLKDEERPVEPEGRKRK